MRRLILAAALIGTTAAIDAVAQAEPACTLPAEPQAVAAAIDAAISGPTDKDRSCMRQLFLPDARLIVAAVGADGAPTYTVLSLDDWIARVRARGNALIQEQQLKYSVQRFGGIAHLWSTYAVYSDGKQAARGINSIHALQVAGGWRVLEVLWQAESTALPLPKDVLP